MDQIPPWGIMFLPLREIGHSTDDQMVTVGDEAVTARVRNVDC